MVEVTAQIPWSRGNLSHMADQKFQHLGGTGQSIVVDFALWVAIHDCACDPGLIDERANDLNSAGFKKVLGPASAKCAGRNSSYGRNSRVLASIIGVDPSRQGGTCDHMTILAVRLQAVLQNGTGSGCEVGFTNRYDICVDSGKEYAFSL